MQKFKIHDLPKPKGSIMWMNVKKLKYI